MKKHRPTVLQSRGKSHNTLRDESSVHVLSPISLGLDDKSATETRNVKRGKLHELETQFW